MCYLSLGSVRELPDIVRELEGAVMAEGPIDLIRLEGEGNSVVLRIIEGSGDGDLLGEFQIETPFVRGSLRTWVVAKELREWQQALDTLDAGYDIAWRDGTSVPWLFIELDDEDDRCHVTVKDHSMSLTAVTVTVPLTDAWFDDAYQRLDLVSDTFGLSEN